MEGIKLWISSLSGVTLIMAVISSVVPKNTAGKVCVLLGEIALITTLILPIKGALAEEVPSVGAVYKEEISKKAVAAKEICGEMEDRLISEKLSAYVLNKAGTRGELHVTLEGKVPVLAEGQLENRESAEKVQRLLTEELKIPKEKQKIRIEGE